ncbi:hypothetical protein [Bradyrhizobium sp. dw_78]|uniref:hypothetical protein n=1 Tax=Bradyrhizobium sp. dw_78 TaxID=2719793 RepID=UPI001BD6B1BB|nr:hypothetical protein [Bradyrhizobium sp. dw_78]
MTIKASGHSALILAAGFWICAAGSSQAASDDSTATPVARHSSHHWKKSAHHQSSKATAKSSDSNKTADVADSTGDNSRPPRSAQMPPSVANANAQLAADIPASNDAKLMAERANNIVQAAPDKAADAQPATDAPVVAADQLNDVDRALHEAAAQPVASTSADAQAAMANAPVVAASGGGSSWDQASLIGKIFIGVGALLTMASAARMFMT